nr:MAG TPA: hypothetical protein [Caudoviricetes sp.]
MKNKPGGGRKSPEKRLRVIFLLKKPFFRLFR